MISLVPSPNLSSGCIFEQKCPNSYYAPPRVTEIQKMPAGVRVTLDELWNRSIHKGRSIRIFGHKHVFVAKEGLVFDQDLNLIPESRTYHSDEEINKSIEDIKTARLRGHITSFKKSILSKSRGADNYGHFILEMLPRAWFARKNLNVPDWPVLVHETNPVLQRIMEEALSLAGFEKNQIVVSGNEPVFVEELVVVDGLTSHTQYLSPYVMQCLDEITESIPTVQSNKLYVSRGPGASRDFVDESKVAGELTKLGYEAKFTGTMSFKEQITAFQRATSVVGVLGAALSNIAFCRPGTDIHCFMPSSACEVLFWMLAERRNLRYHEIRCAEDGPQLGPLPWDRSISLPKNTLARLV